tara:strand:- start:191 stop:460 length:270 start_codon:yes stop_codon:yes gene_type:complete
MKITVELFGAAREFSNSNFINVILEKNCKVGDIKEKLNDYIDNNFSGNKSFKRIIENSSFCSEKDEIIKENELLKQDQKISIIPPIGGG